MNTWMGREEAALDGPAEPEPQHEPQAANAGRCAVASLESSREADAQPRMSRTSQPLRIREAYQGQSVIPLGLQQTSSTRDRVAPPSYPQTLTLAHQEVGSDKQDDGQAVATAPVGGSPLVHSSGSQGRQAAKRVSSGRAGDFGATANSAPTGTRKPDVPDQQQSDVLDAQPPKGPFMVQPPASPTGSPRKEQPAPPDGAAVVVAAAAQAPSPDGGAAAGRAEEAPDHDAAMVASLLLQLRNVDAEDGGQGAGEGAGPGGVQQQHMTLEPIGAVEGSIELLGKVAAEGERIFENALRALRERDPTPASDQHEEALDGPADSADGGGDSADEAARSDGGAYDTPLRGPRRGRKAPTSAATASADSAHRASPSQDHDGRALSTRDTKGADLPLLGPQQRQQGQQQPQGRGSTASGVGKGQPPKLPIQPVYLMGQLETGKGSISDAARAQKIGAAPPNAQCAPPRPPRNHKGPLLCSNCGTTQTPLWRKDRDSGLTVCNACGIYKQTHGFDRPVGTRSEQPQPVVRRHPLMRPPPGCEPNAPVQTTQPQLNTADLAASLRATAAASLLSSGLLGVAASGRLQALQLQQLLANAGGSGGGLLGVQPGSGLAGGLGAAAAKLGLSGSLGDGVQPLAKQQVIPLGLGMGSLPVNAATLAAVAAGGRVVALAPGGTGVGGGLGGGAGLALGGLQALQTAKALGEHLRGEAPSGTQVVAPLQLDQAVVSLVAQRQGNAGADGGIAGPAAQDASGEEAGPEAGGLSAATLARLGLQLRTVMVGGQQRVALVQVGGQGQGPGQEQGLEQGQAQLQRGAGSAPRRVMVPRHLLQHVGVAGMPSGGSSDMHPEEGLTEEGDRGGEMQKSSAQPRAAGTGGGDESRAAVPAIKEEVVEDDVVYVGEMSRQPRGNPDGGTDVSRDRRLLTSPGRDPSSSGIGGGGGVARSASSRDPRNQDRDLRAGEGGTPGRGRPDSGEGRSQGPRDEPGGRWRAGDNNFPSPDKHVLLSRKRAAPDDAPSHTPTTARGPGPYHLQRVRYDVEDGPGVGALRQSPSRVREGLDLRLGGEDSHAPGHLPERGDSGGGGGGVDEDAPDSLARDPDDVPVTATVRVQLPNGQVALLPVVLGPGTRALLEEGVGGAGTSPLLGGGEGQQQQRQQQREQWEELAPAGTMDRDCADSPRTRRALEQQAAPGLRQRQRYMEEPVPAGEEPAEAPTRAVPPGYRLVRLGQQAIPRPPPQPLQLQLQQPNQQGLTGLKRRPSVDELEDGLYGGRTDTGAVRFGEVRRFVRREEHFDDIHAGDEQAPLPSPLRQQAGDGASGGAGGSASTLPTGTAIQQLLLQLQARQQAQAGQQLAAGVGIPSGYQLVSLDGLRMGGLPLQAGDAALDDVEGLGRASVLPVSREALGLGAVRQVQVLPGGQALPAIVADGVGGLLGAAGGSRAGLGGLLLGMVNGGGGLGGGLGVGAAHPLQVQAAGLGKLVHWNGSGSGGGAASGQAGALRGAGVRGRGGGTGQAGSGGGGGGGEPW